MAKRTPEERREAARLQQARWRAKNPERARELMRESVRRWRLLNPEEAKAQTRAAGARLTAKRRIARKRAEVARSTPGADDPGETTS